MRPRSPSTISAVRVDGRPRPRAASAWIGILAVSSLVIGVEPPAETEGAPQTDVERTPATLHVFGRR